MSIINEIVWITDDIGEVRCIRGFPPNDLEGFIEWVEFELAYLIEKLEDRNPDELAIDCVRIWELIDDCNQNNKITKRSSK